MGTRDDPELEGLDPREATRLRRRERRRRTPMVLDNAAVKRIQLALRARARRRVASGAHGGAAEDQRKP